MISNVATPWPEAVEFLRGRVVKGSPWNTADWNMQMPQVRARSFFSATVENVRFLERAKGLLGSFLAKERESVVGPDGKLRVALKIGDRATFVKLMREFMVAEGMAKAGEFPEGEGDLTDIRSAQRLNLIFDTHVRSAYGYAKYKQGMKPLLLDAFPAARFVRLPGSETKRPRHEESEGEVRLKTDVKWWANFQNGEDIGGFGVPWPPYGFHSHMDQRDVSRKVAEKMGLLKKGATVPGTKKTDGLTLNDKLKAALRKADPALKKRVREAIKSYRRDGYKGAAAIVKDEVIVKPPPPAPPVSFDKWSAKAKAELIAEGDRAAKDVARLQERMTQARGSKARALNEALGRVQQATNAARERLTGKDRERYDRLPAELRRRFFGPRWKDLTPWREEDRDGRLDDAIKAWYEYLDHQTNEEAGLAQLARRRREWGKMFAGILGRPASEAGPVPAPVLTSTLKTAENKRIRASIKEARAILNRILPKDVAALVLDVKHGKKAGRSQHSSRHNKISMGTDRLDVVLHEYMHALEHKLPEVLKRAIAHREERTKGDPVKRLKDLVPGAGYKAHEITKEDDFVDPYAGRIYQTRTLGDYASEITTMALQELFRDPSRLFKKDPKLADYILETLYLLQNGTLR